MTSAVESTSARPIGERVVVVACLGGSEDRRRRTVRSLEAAVPGATVVTADTDLRGALESAVDAVPSRHVVVAFDHVLVAPGALLAAVEAADREPRIATVSFLSDEAGYLSVPADVTPDGDEQSFTHVLRSSPPTMLPVPIPSPAGALVLVSRHALALCGPLGDDALPPAASVVDLAARAQRHGFVNVLDPSTYVTRPHDSGPRAPDALAGGDGDELARRHPMLTTSLRLAAAPDSAVGLAMAAATVRLRGLAVIIDGTSLRPEEMGTQVHTTALVRALADHPGVARITVAVHGDVPRYAAAPLRHEKVRLTSIDGLDLSGVDAADIVHRPFQPDRPIPFDNWRSRAPRVVTGLQDLILYQVGTYFGDGADWSALRDALRSAAVASDAVTVISDDVRRLVISEAFGVDPSRLFAVPLGTDHLRDRDTMSRPAGLPWPDDADPPFLLVLGTDYPHKNLPVAVGAWRILRATRTDLHLVVAGPQMPFSGRVARGAEPDGPVELGDVTSEERNWLLGHAAVVLYPTSAEGFGFVPFEAAHFSTPTVEVAFGPLGELAGALPVTSPGWAAADFAAATARLLDDADARRAQLDAMDAAAARHTWAATADRLVEVYRTVLSRPPVPRDEAPVLRRRLDAVVAERDVARAELDAVVRSRSYRLALRIASAARLLRR